MTYSVWQNLEVSYIFCFLLQILMVLVQIRRSKMRSQSGLPIPLVFPLSHLMRLIKSSGQHFCLIRFQWGTSERFQLCEQSEEVSHRQDHPQPCWAGLFKVEQNYILKICFHTLFLSILNLMVWSISVRFNSWIFHNDVKIWIVTILIYHPALF